MRRALVCAIAAAAAMPAAGEAQPVSGFYIHGAIGGNFPLGAVTAPGPRAGESTPLPDQRVARPAPAGSGSFGYGLGNGLRFEVEGRGNGLRLPKGP